MFTEEVGVSPTIGDGGASYRARLEQLIRGGRAFARIEGGEVIVKAARSIAPLVSLYVNDFNTPARAAYRRAGFTEAGRLMSVLF
jgi:predicted GNAT family acetyltransferase